jgi:type VI secretion system protein
MAGGFASRAGAGVLLLAAALIGGCGGGDVDVRTVEIRVVEAANDDSPVPVDMVLVSDQALIDQILALSAADWFRKRAQFQRDHPATLTVYSWELVPGQVVPRHDISRPDSLWAAVVFANYDGEGAHRLRVDTQTDLTLRLGEEDIDSVP